MKARMENGLSYLLPNMTSFVFAVFFIAALGFGPRMMNIDGDLGRHIVVGDYILTNQSIPVNDLFSHSKYGDPVTPHEWLSQGVFALVNRLSGLNGVVILCAVLIGTVYAWAYHFSVRKSGSPLASLFVVILAASAGSLHWLTRPHLFTLLFLIIWYDLLDRLVSGKKSALWLLPITMLCWVNLHGAFIAGFALLAGFVAGVVWDGWFARSINPDDARRRIVLLFTSGLSSAIVTLVNPVGWRIWETSIGYLQNRYLVSHTAEYLPPDFHQSSTWPFLLLICLSLLVIGLIRPNIPGYMPFLVAGWTGMALVSTRNIPLYGIIVSPLLAISLKSGNQLPIFRSVFRLDSKISMSEKMIKGWIFPILVIVCSFFLLSKGVQLDFGSRGNQFLPEKFPVDAVNWLEENPQDGNMFNYFPWGGYMLYRLWPENRVFIDGQTDFYGEELTRVYESILEAQLGWETNLENFGIDWIIFPKDEPLVQKLVLSPDWEQIYEDSVSVILRRELP